MSELGLHLMEVPRSSALYSLAVFTLAILLGGCASQSVFTDQDAARRRFEMLVQRQQAEQTSYAALARVKLAHEGRVNDFRLDLYSEGDRNLSVYARGFLGSSAFKALLRGDSLLVYFPSERKYFAGLRGDLESGELHDSRHIIDYLLSLFSSAPTTLDPNLWDCELKGGASRINQRLADKVHGCQLASTFRVDDAEFPYLSLKQIEIATADGKFKGVMTFQNSRYNKQIPAAKFALDVPPNSILLSKDELADFLTQ